MRNMLGLAVVAAVLSPLAACSSSKSTQVSAEDARDLLIDRNWLDRMPETDRDHLFVYRFVPNMGGGVFQDRTLYKGTFELFSFSVKDSEITFKLHETKTEVTSGYTIATVEGPPPFDLKLTIADDPRGPKVYFGMKSETDRDGTGLDRLLQSQR
ncbi:MAG: hypothetical protein H0T42_22920 [Deltaproteobacteria bacterium]|nr:hypothetical protein [Deltaproteobacteria bacterium]